MKKLTQLLILCFSTLTLAQVSFEEGSFTTKNGEKTNCYIKNSNWSKTPEKIQYKLTEDADVQSVKTDELREFIIDDAIKFKSIDTEFDVSENKDIQLVPRTIFAQVLVEGAATLYSYRDDNKTRYFFSANDSKAKELIQKEYLEGSQKKYNNDYLVKLNEEVECIENSDFPRIKLNEKELKTYFINYNDCKNSGSSFIKESQKIKLSLTVFAGINSSGLELNQIFQNQFIDEKIEFENQVSPTFGLEAEALLPINNYKYSIVSGFTYRSYSSETKSMDGNESFAVDYSSIEINLGARHYMHLNDVSKLYLEASVVMDVLLNDEISLEFDPVSGIQSGDFNNVLNPKSSVSFALGYNYKKIGLRFKYFTSRKMFTPKIYDSKYNNISLQLTYKVL